MHEPDVTLTDYGLVLECATFAVLLGLAPAGRRLSRAAAVCFFATLGAAAAAGGTVHGFFPDDLSAGSRWLWLLTLELMGLASLSAWILGAGMLRPGGDLRRLVLPAFLGVAVYEMAVLLSIREYWVTMTVYLPATCLLLVGFVREHRRSRHPHLLAGATGLALTFVAAFVQAKRIGIHPIYFNHNALYHVVQAAALALIYLGARRVLAPERAGVDAPLGPGPAWPARAR
jgi:hypothetical protein